MAASMKQLCLTLCMRKSLVLLKPNTPRNKLLLFARLTTKADQTDHDEETASNDIERGIAKLRDVSNLNKYQKEKFLGVRDTTADWGARLMKNRKFLRHKYASLGAASGINPGIMWPSKGELDELVEIERDWEPSFQELVARVQENQHAIMTDQKRRDEKVEKSMAKMGELIKQYHEKQKKGIETDKKQSERTEELMDEFREIYGYTVTEDVGKFKSFRVGKLEEEKLQKKKMKKEARKEKSMQMLQEMSAKSKKPDDS